MIIDTSAILAILFGEPDASRYEEAIAVAQPRLISVATLLEAAMVVESRGGCCGWARTGSVPENGIH